MPDEYFCPRGEKPIGEKMPLSLPGDPPTPLSPSLGQSVAYMQYHLPTCPSCTHLVCSPDVGWGTVRLLLPCLSSGARCQDTEPCTWAQKRPQSHTHLYYSCSLDEERVKVCLATSAEISRICVGKQTQLAWPSDAPSAPGTSPGVSPTRRQSVLQGTSEVI